MSAKIDLDFKTYMSECINIIYYIVKFFVENNHVIFFYDLESMLIGSII